METGNTRKDEQPKEKKIPVKNVTDLQKLKLDRLFKNIEKPVHVPERPKAATFSKPAEFVRNVMGSSAGAGSGEFHVYRHIRRREYARQKFIQQEASKEGKDAEYQQKLEENRIAAEQRTAKKRAKRQKQKARQRASGKEKRAKTAVTGVPEASAESESESELEGDSGAAETGDTEPSVQSRLQDESGTVEAGDTEPSVQSRSESESGAVETDTEPSAQSTSENVSRAVETGDIEPSAHSRPEDDSAAAETGDTEPSVQSRPEYESRAVETGDAEPSAQSGLEPSYDRETASLYAEKTDGTSAALDRMTQNTEFDGTVEPKSSSDVTDGGNKGAVENS